jgi:hypothetical protein
MRLSTSHGISSVLACVFYEVSLRELMFGYMAIDRSYARVRNVVIALGTLR